MYSLNSSVDTAAKSLHLLQKVPDFAIHEWACTELKKVIQEKSNEVSNTIENLQNSQPAIFQQIGKINASTREKANLCMELKKINAEKEWYEWRGLIEKRLSKDFEDLTKKIQGDIHTLKKESSRSDTLKSKHISELQVLNKVESLQRGIIEQHEMVKLFEDKVGRVRKHVAQAKEDINYSMAMKQDLEGKIDTYDQAIEKKEVLSKELSSIQDVYEISKQFNSWQCNEMTADSIQFERLHYNGMKHLIRISTIDVNGNSKLSCDVWLEDSGKDNYNSIFKELLLVQDLACDSMMENIATKLDVRDAMLEMDVMFGRCRLLANEVQYIESNFTCEDITFGRGSHLSFKTSFTNLGIQQPSHSISSQSKVTTKWTVQFCIGFGYPAGDMEVSIECDFGVEPIRHFDVRSFGKGFNRLLRVCNGVQQLFFDSVQ